MSSTGCAVLQVEGEVPYEGGWRVGVCWYFKADTIQCGELAWSPEGGEQVLMLRVAGGNSFVFWLRYPVRELAALRDAISKFLANDTSLPRPLPLRSRSWLINDGRLFLTDSDQATTNQASTIIPERGWQTSMDMEEGELWLDPPHLLNPPHLNQHQSNVRPSSRRGYT